MTDQTPLRSHGWNQKLLSSEGAVAVAWVLTLLIIFARVAVASSRNSVYGTYAEAGAHWLAGSPLYITWGGFVYSPLVAAFFAPFALLPVPLGNVLWRMLNVAIYLGGLWSWIRCDLGGHSRVGRHSIALVLALLLPLSIGNFNNGQVNPAIAGLLMFSVSGALEKRWSAVALCLALVTYFKLYPIVLGFLLVLLFPKRLTLRLILALCLLGLLTFLLQRPAYVADQYREWFLTRTQDNRHLYKLRLAPRDLWLLLNALRVPIGASVYKCLQVLAGGSIALFALISRQRRSEKETLGDVAILSVCWMLLLGPATESATYVLLAPFLALSLVEAFRTKAPLFWRGAVGAAYLLLLLGLSVNSFTRANRDEYTRIIQPLAATIFTAGFVFHRLRQLKGDTRPPAIGIEGSPA